MDTSLILIGVGCIIAGIIGGGLKIATTEFGKIDSLWRQGTLAVFGFIVAGFGLVSSGQLNLRALTGAASQPSSGAQAVASVAATPSASPAASTSAGEGSARAAPRSAQQTSATASSAGATPRSVPQASVAAPSATSDNAEPRGVAAANVVRTIFRMMSHQENADFARFYADTVEFHGASIPKSAVISQKTAIMQRFPYRVYTPRGMRHLCNPTSCTVNARVDFAPSAGHDNGQTGTAEFNFKFTDGRIVAESAQPI
jgi:hypothetical protein